MTTLPRRLLPGLAAAAALAPATGRAFQTRAASPAEMAAYLDAASRCATPAGHLALAEALSAEPALAPRPCPGCARMPPRPR